MNFDKGTVIKGALLLALVLCGFFVLRSESVQSMLTAQALQSAIERVGPWAPVVFVLIFAILGALPFPGSTLVIAGAALFGFWKGLGLSLLGAILGAIIAFVLARTLGRDIARRLAGPTLHKYDERLSRDGFRTILYLRLLMLPFTPVNYTAGLSSVKMRDYVFASAIGLIPSIVFLTLFTAAIRDVVLEHGLLSMATLQALVRWDVLLAGVLLLACFSIPHFFGNRLNSKIKRN